MSTLISVEQVRKVFRSGTFTKRSTVALDNVTWTIPKSPATITAIAGESGSGKTTLARLLLGLISPSAGSVVYDGNDVAKMDRRMRRRFRREVQAIYQDPFEVYNPFYRAVHVMQSPIVEFGLASSRKASSELINRALHEVGLRPEDTLSRYPHQLSGGQRQRMMIARVLLINPNVIVADEPVSMVDASLRATILELLRSIHASRNISLIYITHDLTTAYQLADNIVVLYRGRVVESGSVEEVIKHPKHPYTQLLIESIPQPNPSNPWERLPVRVTGDGDDTSGSRSCNFADRCPFRMARCSESAPPFIQTDDHRLVRCFLHEGPSFDESFDLSQTFVSSNAAKIAEVQANES